MQTSIIIEVTALPEQSSDSDSESVS